MHTILIQLAEAFGHPHPEGICNSISIRWLEASLCGEEHIFNARMQYLKNFYNKVISEELSISEFISALKSKKNSLSSADQLNWDMLAFFDSLELYQNPYIHSELFNKNISQDKPHLISPFASSESILMQGGLARILNDSGLYTETELTNYLNKIFLCFIKHLSQGDVIGIILKNYNHTLTLTYKAGEGWTLLNINDYPAKKFSIKNTDLLAKEIISGFKTLGVDTVDYTACNASVFVTNNYNKKNELTKSFIEFQKNKIFTPEIANRKITQDLNLGIAYLAVLLNDVNTLARIAKYVELNNTSNGNTLVSIAAAHNFPEILAVLGAHGANMNVYDANSFTPLHTAILLGYENIVNILLKYGADLHQTDSKGRNLLFTAIASQPSFISLLLEKGINPNQEDNNKTTALSWAVYNNSQESVNRLLENKNLQNINKANNYGWTPALFAALNGDPQILSKLLLRANFLYSHKVTNTSLLLFVREYFKKRDEEIPSTIKTNLNKLFSRQNNDQYTFISPEELAEMMGHVGVAQLIKITNVVAQSSSASSSFFKSKTEEKDKNSSNGNNLHTLSR